MSTMVMKYIVDVMCSCLSFVFQLYGAHRDLHVLTHSFPTRRSSGLGRGDGDEVAQRRDDAGDLHRLGEHLGQRNRARAGRDEQDRKSTRLNSSHSCAYRMPPSAGKKKTEKVRPQL